MPTDLLPKRCDTKGNLILPLGGAGQGEEHTYLKRQLSVPPNKRRRECRKNKEIFKKDVH